MADYKFTLAGVKRAADGASIPNSATNRDWRKYQDWLALGNVPDPADPETVRPIPPDFGGKADDDATFRTKAQAFVTGLGNYLDLDTPTAAQRLAMEKALIRTVLFLVRRVL